MAAAWSRGFGRGAEGGANTLARAAAGRGDGAGAAACPPTAIGSGDREGSSAVRTAQYAAAAAMSPGPRIATRSAPFPPRLRGGMVRAVAIPLGVRTRGTGGV